VAVEIGVSVGCAVGGEVAWAGVGVATTELTTAPGVVLTGTSVAPGELTVGSGVLSMAVTMVAPAGTRATCEPITPLPASELSTTAPDRPPITVYMATDA